MKLSRGMVLSIVSATVATCVVALSVKSSICSSNDITALMAKYKILEDDLHRYVSGLELRLLAIEYTDRQNVLTADINNLLSRLEKTNVKA